MEMARVTGLEPATSGVTGRHSNQLSYTRAFHGPPERGGGSIGWEAIIVKPPFRRRSAALGRRSAGARPWSRRRSAGAGRPARGLCAELCIASFEAAEGLVYKDGAKTGEAR